jgi:hypothetical protein
MAHLTDDQLYNYVFEHAPLAPEASEHLTLCHECQAKQEQFETLANELLIARLSEPGQEELNRYYEFFQEVQTEKASSWFSEMLESIKLALQSDSRQQMATLGLRQSSTVSYRLLYSASQADVELLVEPLGRTRRVEGDILPLDPGTIVAPILVQLQPQTGTLFSTLIADSSGVGKQEYIVASDQVGRFQIEGVMPGIYDLLLTPVKGPLMTIEGLEIA